MRPPAWERNVPSCLSLPGQPVADWSGQPSPCLAIGLFEGGVSCPPTPPSLSPLPPREPPTRGLGHNLCWKLLAEYQPDLGPQPQAGCRLLFHNGFLLPPVCLSQGHCPVCPPPLPRLVTHALRSSPPSPSEVLGCERPLLPVGQVSHHLPPGQDVVGSGPPRLVGTGLGSAPSHIGAIQGPAAPQARLARSIGPAGSWVGTCFGVSVGVGSS